MADNIPDPEYPPVIVGSIVHVPEAYPCWAAIVTRVDIEGTVAGIEPFLPPFATSAADWTKTAVRRHNTSAAAPSYSWHRPEECQRDPRAAAE